DEEMLLTVLNKIVTRAGYDVETTRSTVEALRIIQQDVEQKIDLIISDIVMPGMNGVELISKIREIRSDILVLFVSGNIGNVKINPNDLLLMKPFGSSTLIAAIQRLQSNHSMQQSPTTTQTTQFITEGFNSTC
ncbi:response regulator, partial [Patescibacteria group bacterium]|nr:response regulator [Patescibacteria group bacterium]